MSELNEDFLSVDNRIPGQNFCCISFLSPEKVMKNKEVFFVTKFLHNVFNSQDRVYTDVREKMRDTKNITYNYINELYNDWKFNKNNDLELEFSEVNDYATSMRGVKVRGTYETLREAKKRAQLLQKRDKNFNVFVGQVGYWLPWDPQANDVEEQEYQEGRLNELMKKYQENADNRDFMYEQDKDERLKRAREEVRRRKDEAERVRREEKEREPLRLDNVDVATEKIGELREILNEVDENVYETEKAKMEAEKTKFEKEKIENEPLKIEEIQSELEKDIKEETENLGETLNNFKSETVESLDKMDPWMQRKIEQEQNQSQSS
jgi:hypothetical protein